MSKEFSRSLEVMERLARKFIETVEDSCVRIQVAGSVRRRKPFPSDIEIVVEPKFRKDPQPAEFWGTTEPIDAYTVNLFDECCKELIRCGILEKRQKSNGHTSWGEKAKLGILYLGGEWAPIDIFSVVEPTTYGVILALRTGPGDFNKVLVNHAHTIGRKVAGGRVWDLTPFRDCCKWKWLQLPSSKFIAVAQDHGVQTMDTPTEEEYFKALGVPCWPPEERTVKRSRQYLGR
jgi:DNA polymerase/3'-5' exonuclease PolX